MLLQSAEPAGLHTLSNGESVELPPPDEFYSQLVLRQHGLIPPDDQQRLRTSTILIAGCGSIGGSVVEPLVRLGAENLILAEPDGTFLARDALKLLAYADDFNVVLGTRTTRELLWSEANMGWFLRLGNILVAKLLEVLHGGPSLSDCGCTLRLIDRTSFAKIKPHLSVGGSHFLVDMTICALAERLGVIEIPVNYRARVGVSKITGTLRGTLVTGGRMLALIVGRRLRPRCGIPR